LEDVLACITAAHRWTTEKCPDGHAQWVWLSSEPYFKGKAPHYHWNEGFDDGRSSVPGTGNYLHTFTSKLARWLKVNVLVPRLTQFVFVCRISDCGRWWELAAPGHPTTNLKSSLNVFLLLGLGEVLSPFFLAGSLQPLPLQLLVQFKLANFFFTTDWCRMWSRTRRRLVVGCPPQPTTSP
jgi:hypothetical protein